MTISFHAFTLFARLRTAVTHRSGLWGLFGLVLVLGGCDAVGWSVGDSEGPTSPERVDVDGTPGESVPVVEPKEPFRMQRRMDLDQLDAAIREVTGGLGWTEERGDGGQTHFWVELSSTLGKPDFIQITEEDLMPSAMFQKFMDDAARSVCARLIEREVTASTAERVFFVYTEPNTSISEDPGSVKTNLQYLLLRFHGRFVAIDGGEMEPWSWLMVSTEHVVGEPMEAWRSICVGLMTHPDFYTY